MQPAEYGNGLDVALHLRRSRNRLLLPESLVRAGLVVDMPIESWRNFDDTEMHAVWAYLRTLPPTPFGQR